MSNRAEQAALATGLALPGSDRSGPTDTEDAGCAAVGRPIGRPVADMWVRRCCALVVAGVAAYASYEHQRRFALHGGADAVSAALWPLSVDGLMVLASLGLLAARPRANRRARWSVRLAFGLGVAVSLAANIAAAPVLAWQPVVVAGWPPFALVLAVELLMHGQLRDERSETGNSRDTGRNRGSRPIETAADGQDSKEPAVSPGSRAKSDGDSAADPCGGHAPGHVATLPRLEMAGNVGAQRLAEDVMWAHFQQERARGRTPTGAELDRAAGTNNYGRAVLARWRRTGRVSTADGERPDHARRNGRARPTDRQPAVEPGTSRPN